MKNRRRFPKIFFILYIVALIAIIARPWIRDYGFTSDALLPTILTIVLLGAAWYISFASAVIVHEFGLFDFRSFDRLYIRCNRFRTPSFFDAGRTPAALCL